MKKEETRFAESNIMEGMISFRAVIRGMESGISDRKIEKVIFDTTRKKNLKGHLSYIRAMSVKYNFPIEEVSKEEIDTLAIGSSHGGILIYTSDRTLPILSEIPKQKGFYVLLNGIEDPYNFGYALRSLYAAGVDGIIVGKRNWMSAAGVVCRASAGASEEMPIFVVESETDAAKIFKQNGYRLVAADLENSTPMTKANLKKPILLAVGGEKRGLASDLLAMADEIVRIEYGREFKESLSAASAASILSFFVLAQNS